MRLVTVDTTTNGASPKRPRFADKHKRDGERLAVGLRYLVEVFPRFAPDIEQWIGHVVQQSQRTRESDRQLVLGLLKEWKYGLGLRDIMEDTGFSEWDVRQILRDLARRKLVIEKPEARDGVNPTRWRTLYVLKP